MSSIAGIAPELLIGGSLLALGGGLVAKVVRATLASRRADAVRREECRAAWKQRLATADQQSQSPTSIATPSQTTWQGYRRFVVVERVQECVGVQSLILEAEDGRPIASYKPGQFLTLRVSLPGEANATVRCYSLSDRPQAEYYRITVKAIGGDDSAKTPPGKMSNYLASQVQVGEVIEAQAPRGDFHLRDDDRPPILIGAGIGVTPLVAMAHSLLESGFQLPVVMFVGARRGTEHPFREELHELACEYKNFLYVPCYSQPDATDVKNRDYRFAQRLNLELIQRVVPYRNFPFYLCGPSTFMGTLVAELMAWGVHSEDLHFEAFGPSTVRTVTPQTNPQVEHHGPHSRVVFSESHKTEEWNDDCESILELAETLGVNLPYGCRSGNCGMCATKVLEGRVKHSKPPAAPCEADECLACLAHPDSTDLVLRA